MRRILRLQMDFFKRKGVAVNGSTPHPPGPVIVGGGGPNQRGVVSTASYEARKFGVHSAMPLRTAGRLCPHGIFVPVDGRKYQEESRRVMAILRRFTPQVQPVSIDDVVVALAGALELPLTGSEWFDVPGPGTLSGREILEETARIMNLPRTRMLAVPFLSPRLSSLWVRFVTRAEWAVAREVVVGLTEDLLARDDRFWQLIGHPQRLPFAEGARRAVAAERSEGPAPGFWGAIERARGLRQRPTRAAT